MPAMKRKMTTQGRRTVGRAAYKPQSSMRISSRYYSGLRGLNRRGVASRETGFVDTAVANFNCDTTGTIALVPTIAQGASVNQRVGKKVLLKNVQIRGSGFAGAATLASDSAIMLVYDRRPTGSLPAITDILVTANSASFNNDANSGRFEILYRKNFEFVGNLTAPATGREAVTADKFLNLKMRPMVFKAAGTGAIGDIEQGALYCVTVGSVAAGTTAPTYNIGFRTRFLDV